MAPDEDLDRLYGLPLEEFTAGRDRLAAELSERDDRTAAVRVKKLRRPTLPAWIVNQLVRSHRSEIDELLSLGQEVRAAQRAALSGGRTQGMREITVRRRRALDRLLDLAEELLAQAGHATSRSTLDRIGDTLMAATVDEGAADNVRAGRLERELSAPSGFEAAAAIPDVAEIGPKQQQRARERARKAKEEARKAEESAREADREARRLEQEADRIREDAERARRRADQAAERARALGEKAKE
ncbi:MAG TPA: hypothetical protein VG602_09755 [Actinomycetota bacterium]|nr:hypothetical protein [Actinomycetota bacterium]